MNLASITLECQGFVNGWAHLPLPSLSLSPSGCLENKPQGIWVGILLFLLHLWFSLVSMPLMTESSSAVCLSHTECAEFAWQLPWWEQSASQTAALCTCTQSSTGHGGGVSWLTEFRNPTLRCMTGATWVKAYKYRNKILLAIDLVSIFPWALGVCECFLYTEKWPNTHITLSLSSKSHSLNQQSVKRQFRVQD